MKSKKLFFLSISFCLCIFNAISSNALNISEKYNGEYLTEFKSKDIGMARTIFYLKIDGSKFTFNTREGFSKIILGWWKSFLARTFTNEFNNGSLINIENGAVSQNGNELKLDGIFESSLGRYYFKGSLIGDSIKIELLNGKYEKIGSIIGAKYSGKKPLDNYDKLFKCAFDTTEKKIFNPTMTRSKTFETFKNELNELSSKINDDLEAVVSFFYLSRELPFTHYAFMKIDTSSGENKLNNQSNIESKEINKETAYIKIKSFESGAYTIDSILTNVIINNYSNLIIDLRGNEGGNIGPAYSLAKYLISEPINSGVFLTQKWFNSNKYIPDTSEYRNFQTLTDATFELIISGVHKEKGLVVKLLPAKTVFKGNIFFVIDRYTASTCEPLIYEFKKNKKATLVGEKSAGAMLNGEIFNICGGFQVIVPTADYYTSDGFHIDGTGVSPDIIISPNQALDYIINNEIKNHSLQIR